ncbi:MAG: XRE family transcriptional regulator [Oscillospiraceae bacterium]|nr:XRE family transcriptional regulator [Oscillospiraceae bacterium]
MRIRHKPLGDRNLIGSRVEQRRLALGFRQKELLTQLQVRGIDMTASGLSKLEGQVRIVTDKELKGLAEVLHVSYDWLLGIPNEATTV